jgi:hypothetical protein
MCHFDLDQKRTTTDGFFKQVIERFLDRYAFGAEDLPFSSDLEREAFSAIEAHISDSLTGVAPDLLTKVLGAVCRSIKSHPDGRYAGRNHVVFIHHYVGAGV